MKIEFKWEKIVPGTHRAKVIGGWILNVFNENTGEALVFIPDPNHEWEVQ